MFKILIQAHTWANQKSLGHGHPHFLLGKEILLPGSTVSLAVLLAWQRDLQLLPILHENIMSW